MKKSTLNWGLSLIAAIAVVGCSGSNETPKAEEGKTAATKTVEGKALKLAFVTNNASDFWTIARKGTEKADEELSNVEVEFRLPSDGTAAEQKRILDDLIAKGIQGIAVSPVDPKNQSDWINTASEKTLIVTQDSDAPDSKRAFYVGTDNVAAGRQAGEEIKKALPNGGKIMVFVGMKDAQNAKERFQGIQEALKGSKVEILDVRTDNTDRVAAKANVSDTLVKTPDVAALVGLWSYNGPAILNAVKDANKIGKVKIICFDEEDETLAGVKDGAIDATIVQQPYEFGYQAITMMAKVLGGDKTAVPESKKTIVDTLVVNKANVEEFSAKLKTLRGR